VEACKILGGQAALCDGLRAIGGDQRLDGARQIAFISILSRRLKTPHRQGTQHLTSTNRHSVA
jgi:hypothetical protein